MELKYKSLTFQRVAQEKGDMWAAEQLQQIYHQQNEQLMSGLYFLVWAPTHPKNEWIRRYITCAQKSTHYFLQKEKSQPELYVPVPIFIISLLSELNIVNADDLDNRRINRVNFL